MSTEITKSPAVNIDLEIAQNAPIRHIKEIAAKLGIPDSDLEYFGKHKSKLPLSLINVDHIQKSNLILVSAISPTPAGEGKTTVSIGLCDGLNKIGKKAKCCHEIGGSELIFHNDPKWGWKTGHKCNHKEKSKHHCNRQCIAFLGLFHNLGNLIVNL